MSREEEAEELIEKLESMEQDMKNGLQQIDDDLQGMENDEKAVKNYEDHLDSLNAEQLKGMEHELEVTTEEGQRTLEDLKELLGMEENSIKILAQVTHLLDRTTEDVGDKEEDIDRMLENLKQQAENGNVDEELAARCVAEILEAREEIMENSEIEEVAGSEAETIGAELGKSHRELVEVKRDEVNLRDEIGDAERWATENDVEELDRFLQEEEAPNLNREMQELATEVNKEKEEEEEFFEVMEKLAEEGKLTEHQIDKLIAEHQTWSAVVKHSLTHGTLSAKKFADALFGFTPAAIAAKAGSGAAEHIEKEDIMRQLGKIEDRVRSTEEAESEAENAVQEAQDSKEKLEQAKAD